MKYLNWIVEVSLQYIIFISHVQSEISNIAPGTKTDFSCLNKTAGFYADTSTNCKIYYTCDDYGNKFMYHCPEETAFRQDALICDHAHLVHCHEHTAFSSKYNEEEENGNSSTKELINIKQFVFHVTPLSKANNKEQHEFIPGAKEFPTDFTKPKIIQHNTTNLYTQKDISFTTGLPANYAIKAKSQRVSLPNNTQENGSIKNESSTVQNQIVNVWNKINEDQINQKDYLYRKTNDASYNFMKISRNTFAENAQNQKNSTKNDQIVKNTTDLLASPFMTHRSDPYLETLKSIQKNRRISSSVTNIETQHTSVITTELPVYALTLSLRPLKPSELEHDPYYPKVSTSTEAYYTPAYNKEWSYVKNHTQATWSSIRFNLPSTLPDLNSLDDIVDRRKLLYIPRLKSSHL